MRGWPAEAQVQGREHPAVRKLGGRSIRVTVALASGRRKQQGKLEPQGLCALSCFSRSVCSGPLCVGKISGYRDPGSEDLRCS